MFKEFFHEVTVTSWKHRSNYDKKRWECTDVVMSPQTKLDNDIAPKLWICHTTREQARSWLSNDPAMRDEVEVFRDTCQNLIEQIKLAYPRPNVSTPRILP